MLQTRPLFMTNFLKKQNFMRPLILANVPWNDIVARWFTYVRNLSSNTSVQQSSTAGPGKTFVEFVPGGGSGGSGGMYS